jgi:hypothetical protein
MDPLSRLSCAPHSGGHTRTGLVNPRGRSRSSFGSLNLNGLLVWGLWSGAASILEFSALHVIASNTGSAGAAAGRPRRSGQPEWCQARNGAVGSVLGGARPGVGGGKASSHAAAFVSRATRAAHRWRQAPNSTRRRGARRRPPIRLLPAPWGRAYRLIRVCGSLRGEKAGWALVYESYETRARRDTHAPAASGAPWDPRDLGAGAYGDCKAIRAKVLPWDRALAWAAPVSDVTAASLAQRRC